MAQLFMAVFHGCRGCCVSLHDCCCSGLLSLNCSRLLFMSFAVDVQLFLLFVVAWCCLHMFVNRMSDREAVSDSWGPRINKTRACCAALTSWSCGIIAAVSTWYPACTTDS